MFWTEGPQVDVTWCSWQFAFCCLGPGGPGRATRPGLPQIRTSQIYRIRFL